MKFHPAIVGPVQREPAIVVFIFRSSFIIGFCTLRFQRSTIRQFGDDIVRNLYHACCAGSPQEDPSSRVLAVREEVPVVLPENSMV